jgi:hypothetical protein
MAGVAAQAAENVAVLDGCKSFDEAIGSGGISNLLAFLSMFRNAISRPIATTPRNGSCLEGES